MYGGLLYQALFWPSALIASLAVGGCLVDLLWMPGWLIGLVAWLAGIGFAFTLAERAEKLRGIRGRLDHGIACCPDLLASCLLIIILGALVILYFAAMQRPGEIFPPPRLILVPVAEAIFMVGLTYWVRATRSLHDAVWAGDTAGVLARLDRGAPINAHDPSHGRTALSWAIQARKAAVVRMLLERGADPNTRDTLLGDFPLIEAIRRCDRDTVRILLAHGADPNLATPHLEPTQRDEDDGGSVTPLMAAVYEPEIVRMLLDAGADVHAADDNGDTALFHAARALPGINRGDGLESIRLLLAHGADNHVRNLAGKTVVQAAEEVGWANDVVIEFLRSAEA